MREDMQYILLSRDLDLCEFKSVPSEVAELASMTMELLSMEAWDEFYTDEEELKRAKREQMEKVLEGLPWIATIDKFQQWFIPQSIRLKSVEQSGLTSWDC